MAVEIFKTTPPKMLLNSESVTTTLKAFIDVKSVVTTTCVALLLYISTACLLEEYQSSEQQV